jgi:hypothetical protein
MNLQNTKVGFDLVISAPNEKERVKRVIFQASDIARRLRINVL